MADREEYKCEECGKIFQSVETLEKHSKVEHGFSARYIQLKEFELPTVSFNKDVTAGFLAGLIVTAALVGGYSYMQNSEPVVDVTVVTCGNCSYNQFRDTTGEMFKVNYQEVNYTSDRGQELVEKYNLYYVPGFIFDRNVENAENFTRIESTVVEFEDAYVLPDRGVTAAQRVSEGKEIHQQG